jgi:hypothetical protein
MGIMLFYQIECTDCGKTLMIGAFRAPFQMVFIWRDDIHMGDLEHFLFDHIGHALKFYEADPDPVLPLKNSEKTSAI